jgi:hypothetical protein
MQSVFTIQELFTDKVLRIPNYQRGYAWGSRQLEEFWEDLEYLEKDKDHYTGTVILHQQDRQMLDEEGKQNKVFHVVDGQQRLTTIVLLLDHLRSQFEETNPTLAQGMRKLYIQFTDSSKQPAFKLNLNPDCQDYWVNSILKSPIGPQGPTIASHARLQDAKEYFTRKVTEEMRKRGSRAPEWLLELFLKLTQQIKITQYIVDKAADVGVIFEVMNDRGKLLSDLEKVKNYLMYVSSKLDLPSNPLSDRVNDTWAEIFERLMSAGLDGADHEDRLLRSHWIMAYHPDSKEWLGSKSIKERFKLKVFAGKHTQLLQELMDYTKTLRDCLPPFCDAYQPISADSFVVFSESARPTLRRAQEKLRRIGVLAPFLPLLMACRIRFPEDEQKYLDILRDCEIFAFRVYRVAGRRSNAGQPRLFRLGYRLFNQELDFEVAERKLRKYALRYCPDKTFRSFTELDEHRSDWYGWSGLKYFLYEYEEHLAGKKEVNLSWDAVLKGDLEKTIEHILPQNSNDKYWKKRFDAAARKRFTDDLGNLSLTADNSAYGRKPFPDKKGTAGSGKKCYANANLFMERELAGFSDWNESSIIQRREKLTDWYLERWHLDDTDIEDIPEEVEEETNEEDNL